MSCVTRRPGFYVRSFSLLRYRVVGRKFLKLLSFSRLRKKDHRHISLKIPNVEFNFDVSIRHCQLSTHASKSNSTLGTHLHAMIRTYHFDFNIRFRPISALENLTPKSNWMLVICVHKGKELLKCCGIH